MLISPEERLRIQHERRERVLRAANSYADDHLVLGELMDRDEDFKHAFIEAVGRGYEKGFKEELQTAVHDLCEIFGISLSAAQEQQLQGMDVDVLTALRAYLKRHRAWPTEDGADGAP